VRRLHDEILAVYLRDNVKARFMQNDFTYVRATPSDGEPPLDGQAWFIEQAAARAAALPAASRRRGRRPAKKGRHGTRSPGQGR
jgi:hypothetical protein